MTIVGGVAWMAEREAMVRDAMLRRDEVMGALVNAAVGVRRVERRVRVLERRTIVVVIVFSLGGIADAEKYLRRLCEK
jgi:hypothetical protein